MDSYYKIGEVAKLYAIGKDTLMYYEELELLEPIRDTNGYRLYHMRDLWRLNVIRELRTHDIPIKRIKAYLDQYNVKETQEMLEEELGGLEAKLQAIIKQKHTLQARLAHITQTVNESIGSIEEQYFVTRYAVHTEARITSDAVVDVLMQVLQKSYKGKVEIIGNPKLGSVFEPGTFQKGIYDVFETVFCMIDTEEGADYTLPAGDYITCSYRGPYQQNNKCIQQMLAYLEARDYQVCGKAFELYKIDIHTTQDESEFVTEVQIPFVRKKDKIKAGHERKEKRKQ